MERIGAMRLAGIRHLGAAAQAVRGRSSTAVHGVQLNVTESSGRPEWQFPEF